MPELIQTALSWIFGLVMGTIPVSLMVMARKMSEMANRLRVTNEILLGLRAGENNAEVKHRYAADMQPLIETQPINEEAGEG